jgi:hypothetical protein
MTIAAVDYEQGVNNAIENVVTFLPRLGLFLLVLVVGVLVAKIVQKVLTKVLQKAGFDRAVERGGIKKALAKSQFDAAGLVGKVVYYFIFLGVLSMAFAAFGANNPISRFLDRIVAFLPNVAVAVVVMVLAAAVATAVKDIITSALGGLSYGSALATASSVLILGLGGFFALSQLQIAPAIVTGLFYAMLALVTLPLIIAFGVGGIQPAQQAIQTLQQRAQEKAQEIKQEAQAEPYPAEPATRSAARPAARRATGTRTTTRGR